MVDKLGAVGAESDDDLAVLVVLEVVLVAHDAEVEEAQAFDVVVV